MATNSFCIRRLQRELIKLQTETPPGIKLLSAPDFSTWYLTLQVLDENNPLYSGKTFLLVFNFCDAYPVRPPEVIFATRGPDLPRDGNSEPKLSNEEPSEGNKDAKDGGDGEDFDMDDDDDYDHDEDDEDDDDEPEIIPSQSVFEVPIHPHIYSNGIICLDLFDRRSWSPVHNVESVCISLQSMLTGNDKNERPVNDDDFVRTNVTRPRDIRFIFHDDKV